MHPFYYTVGLVSWPVIRGLFRERIRGLENLPEGGFVLAPNHVSNLDPWPLGMPLWPERQLNWMAKSELYKPVIGTLISWGGAFPVRRGTGDEGAIETAVERVKEGEVVVIFPEGTRQRKGLVKRYEARPRTGAARVALRAGAPLVPAAIGGTDRLLRLGPLSVAYGPPVDLAGLEGDDREAAREATTRLMADIDKLKAAL
ncbi:MAG TPA: lysophospholipid acyltransferase family protein [Gaiellaceae bacterium]|nr:lysophospholipid acyltransferase family protein [Gaiellaceae bacterium]